MTVNYKPVRSEFGFSSPNFSVDANGNVTATSVSTGGGGSNFVFAGSTVDTVDSSAIEFLTSSVKIDGTLVTGLIGSTTPTSGIDISAGNNVTVTVPVSKRLRLVNGRLQVGQATQLIINSFVDPEQGDMIYNLTTNDLNVFTNRWRPLSTGDITFTGTTIGTYTIDQDITITPQAGGEVVVSDLKVNNTPTVAYHATRKDYVDSTATALAIALGS